MESGLLLLITSNMVMFPIMYEIEKKALSGRKTKDFLTYLGFVIGVISAGFLGNIITTYVVYPFIGNIYTQQGEFLAIVLSSLIGYFLYRLVFFKT